MILARIESCHMLEFPSSGCSRVNSRLNPWKALVQFSPAWRDTASSFRHRLRSLKSPHPLGAVVQRSSHESHDRETFSAFSRALLNSILETQPASCDRYDFIVTENPSQLRRAGLGNGVVRALSIELLERHRRVTDRFPGSVLAALNTWNPFTDDHSRRTLCQA